MRAVILTEFGGTECLEVRDVDRPAPGPGEILVRVKASATNPVEAKLRADGRWAGIEPPVVLGYDAAGVVDATGPGVEGIEEGEEVYFTPEISGNAHGTHAEYTVVPARIADRKPEGLSFEEAAAIPLAGGTAWEAIVRRLRVRPGETVLIQGGAGGVGSFAVQFARAAGARVLATASGRNQETLEALGADVAIDYETEDPVQVVEEETDGAGVDAAFDIAGPDLVSRTLPAVRPFGRIACILEPAGDLTSLYTKNITLHGIFLTRERERLQQMRPLFERGSVGPLVDEVLPLTDVAKAHERLDTGHGRGKIVLEIGDE